MSRLALAALLLLSGCSFASGSAFDPDNMPDLTERMAAGGASGCAWLRGTGTPPLSKVDVDVVYSFGGPDYTVCVQTLRPGP